MVEEVLISCTFHKLENWLEAEQTDSLEPAETQGLKAAVTGWRQQPSQPAGPSESSGEEQ